MSTVADLFNAAGRTALITGGSAGLGYWMAETWVKNGGKVYIVGRREEVLKEAAAKLNGISKDRAFFFSADVTTQDGVDKIAREMSSREASLDVLVNNAGTGLFDPQPEPGMFLPRFDSDMWTYQFSLNVWGPAAMTSALAPLLVEAAKRGSRLNGYNAAKAAERALTKILANKLVAHGVRVNTISPGTFPSPTNDPSNELMPSGRADELVPMKRNGSADDISGAFMYLATKASAYMTGERFAVDGGWSMVINGPS